MKDQELWDQELLERYDHLNEYGYRIELFMHDCTESIRINDLARMIELVIERRKKDEAEDDVT